MSSPPLPPFLTARKPLLLGGLTLLALVGGFGLWSVATTISGAIVTSTWISRSGANSEKRGASRSASAGTAEVAAAVAGAAPRGGTAPGSTVILPPR